MTSKTSGHGSVNRRDALRAGAALGVAALAGASVPRAATAQGATGAPIEPRAGTWKPWLLTSGNQFRPPAPPDAAATAAEIQQLKAMAGRRDTATLDRIKFWDAGAAPYRWNEFYIEYSNITNVIPGSFASRANALINVAMYDAVIAAWDAKYTYNRPRPTEFDSTLTATAPVPRSPSYPSEHAATAGAASAVLAYLYPMDAQSFLNMAEEAARSRVVGGVQYPSDIAAGLDLGRKVAELAIERAKTDNSDARWNGVIPTGPGLWTGMNPGNVSEAEWKPWMLASPSDLRPPPPPAHDSEQMAMELAEIKNFMRTPRTTGLALGVQYGVYGGPGGYIPALRDISQRIFEERLDHNAPWSARAYAMLAVANMDIFITNQDAKFAFWSARPFQLDPSITTVFPTPNFPSYPSNRAAFSAASATVLAHLFPREADAFLRRANEIAESAIWAGIHFRSDIETGKAMGKQIAALVIDRIKDDA